MLDYFCYCKQHTMGEGDVPMQHLISPHFMEHSGQIELYVHQVVNEDLRTPPDSIALFLSGMRSLLDAAGH